MGRRLWIPLSLVLVLAVSSGVVGQGKGKKASPDDDILKMVPDEALGFLLVNRIKETSDKLENIGRVMQLPAEGPLQLLKTQMGIEKGLDEKRGAAFILMPGEEKNEPAEFAFVPVTNYKQFVAQFQPDDADAEIAEITVGGQPYLAARKGSYAVLARQKFKEILPRVLMPKGDLAAAVKPLHEWLKENELTAVATPAGIKAVSEQALESLDQAKAGEGGAQGPALQSLDPALLKGVFTSLPAEISYAGLGLRVDASNAAHLTGRAIFMPEGSLAKEAQTAKPPEGDLFQGVPAEPFVFAWASSARTSLQRKLMEISTDMMRANPMFGKLSEEQAKELKEAFAETAEGVERNSGIIGIPDETESLYARSILIMKVNDSAAYLAKNEKALKKLNEIFKEQKPPITYEVERDKLDDMPMLELTSQMPAGQGLPPGFAEKMFGPGGKLKAYLVATDPKTVIAAYISRDNARKAVELYRQGGRNLNSEADVAKTAALLPEGAQAAAYVSPRGVFNVALSIFAAMRLPIGANLPDFPETPPVGVAAKVTREELEGDLVVPGEVFDAIGDYMAAVRGPQNN